MLFSAHCRLDPTTQGKTRATCQHRVCFSRSSQIRRNFDPGVPLLAICTKTTPGILRLRDRCCRLSLVPDFLTPSRAGGPRTTTLLFSRRHPTTRVFSCRLTPVLLGTGRLSPPLPTRNAVASIPRPVLPCLKDGMYIRRLFIARHSIERLPSCIPPVAPKYSHQITVPFTRALSVPFTCFSLSRQAALRSA